MIPGSELFTIEANNTNATTPRSVALVATDRLDECGALSEMIFKKDHRIVHLTSGRCIYPKGMSFASIVQKLMIFWYKDINEWNILSLKNNIIMKKKRQKIEDEVSFNHYRCVLYRKWKRSLNFVKFIP